MSSGDFWPQPGDRSRNHVLGNDWEWHYHPLASAPLSDRPSRTLDRQLGPPTHSDLGTQPPVESTMINTLRRSHNTGSARASAAASSWPDAVEIIAAVSFKPGTEEHRAGVVFASRLYANDSPLYDRSRQTYLFPTASMFKQVRVRLGFWDPVWINVPDMTFGELKSRLDDGQDGSASRLFVRWWSQQHNFAWTSWEERVDSRDSVWEVLEELRSNSPHEPEIVVRYNA